MQSIFYGVQGTGNGHITRARVMIKALAAAGCTTDFLFSGRPVEQYFDMNVFGRYQVRTGLTFYTESGHVSYLKTVATSKPFRFIRDVRNLDLRAYDQVLCDFEPISAWAAKRAGLPVVGIGHQYAFAYSIPRFKRDYMAETVLRYFAPVTCGVGLHWHHFEQPILPPIIETEFQSVPIIGNKIVVYLPFEDVRRVMEYLVNFKEYQFFIYSPKVIESRYPNIKVNALSRAEFQKDLLNCAGIISNAGFELISEALQMGKKILVKPLHKQMEQLANAAALEQLAYGTVMLELDVDITRRWLGSTEAVKVQYPNVAELIVGRLLNQKSLLDSGFIESVWRDVKVQRINGVG